jgi:hypothetical protein
MHYQVMERGSLAARRDFDLLPRRHDIAVQPAQATELPMLAEIANRLVPGVRMSEADLLRYFNLVPDSILTFNRNHKLLGAVAFIYLNARGYRALIFDEIDLTRPDVRFIAASSEQVSAIYVWAIAGRGRAMAGLGNVSSLLSDQRLAAADLYAQPSSADGRNLMIAIGFEPFLSFQRELWRYQRPWNRMPSKARAMTSSRN